MAKHGRMSLKEFSTMPKRLNWLAVAVVIGLYAVPLSGNAQVDSNLAPRLTQSVDPFIGADNAGATVPGAAVPFGFVELSPDTTHGDTNGYASSGNIIGFSHTHVSGTGGASKYGNFRVTPMAGQLSVGNLNFPKSQEQASPGYYAVTLTGDRGEIRCELTASRLVGMERFTFPAGSEGALIVDASSHVLLAQHATHAETTVLDATHLSGRASFVGGWNPAAYTLYFYAELSRPATRSGTWTADMGSASIEAGRTHLEGDQNSDYLHHIGAFAVFDTTNDRVVELKLAVSFIGVEKARKNLEDEMPGWDFDAARLRAADSWEKVLGKIQVSGGTDTQRRIFYSALYRSHYMPHDLSGENVWWSSAEPHYEDFYTLWDTFRTLHPLLTLIEPDRQRDMIRSLLDTYRHTGWLPDARIGGANGLTQGGSNSDVLIADAVVKGMTGFDYQTAYEALVKNAEVEPKNPLIEGRQLEDYKRLGYMSLSQSRSASRTLEYAYDDFCISEVAHALGRNGEAEKYSQRSSNWANLWNPENRCIRPRYADGRWLENFNPETVYPDTSTAEWWDVPFYEGSALQYSTFVPHEVRGLIERLGGDEAFTRWLDDLFDRKLYDPTNEEDLLAPYLYIHAGRPDRTADRVRALLKDAYNESRGGLPGNDDSGTMSSWYVWGAIGLFPNAGQAFYYIGSPVFRRVSIDLGSGRNFIIDAPESSEANRYVQRAELNGKPLNRAWLTHAEIVSGGRLLLQMGPGRSKWGAAERAPSVSESPVKSGKQ
jgi:predicted alpha-1,2-mannosidase